MFLLRVCDYDGIAGFLRHDRGPCGETNACRSEPVAGPRKLMGMICVTISAFFGIFVGSLSFELTGMGVARFCIILVHDGKCWRPSGWAA